MSRFTQKEVGYGLKLVWELPRASLSLISEDGQTVFWKVNDDREAYQKLSWYLSNNNHGLNPWSYVPTDVSECISALASFVSLFHIEDFKEVI